MINKTIEDIFIDPLVQVALDERPKSHLENEEHFTQRMKAQLIASFEKFQNILLEAINTLQQQGHKSIAERLQQFSEKSASMDYWKDEKRQNMSLQDHLGISDEEMISYYNVGNDLYHHGAFKEASHIFLLLIQLNQSVATFWMALGVAEDTMGHLENALQAYLFAAELDNASLAAYVQAAKCFYALHHPDHAQKVLQRALERENNDPKNRHKAEEMLAALSR